MKTKEDHERAFETWMIQKEQERQARSSSLNRLVGDELSVDDIEEMESIAEIHAEGYETKVAVWEEHLERCQRLAKAGYLKNCGLKPLGERYPGETGIGFALSDKGEKLLLNLYSNAKMSYEPKN